MSEPSRQCPKCDAPMEEGFIADKAYLVVGQDEWVQGPPQMSFWGGVKTRHARRRNVVTYRCTSCGYLESYATKPSQE